MVILPSLRVDRYVEIQAFKNSRIQEFVASEVREFKDPKFQKIISGKIGFEKSKGETHKKKRS